MGRISRYAIDSLLAVTCWCAAASAGAMHLTAPGGIRWGATPQEAQYYLDKTGFKFVGTGPEAVAGNPDQMLHEQRWTGKLNGYESDHVAPLFFGGRMFSFAVSYSPTPDVPAAQLWERLVKALELQYGKPKSRTNPTQMLSLKAILSIAPGWANKGQLMQLYNTAGIDRVKGEHIMNDLQIQIGTWIPDALWEFENSCTVRVVMRAGNPDQNGWRMLKPAVTYTKWDLLK